MKRILLGAALVALAGAANAATIVINHTMDLNTVPFSPTGVNYLTSLQGGPVTVSEGDTVDITLDFAGNQSLQLTNPDKIFAQPLAFPAGIGGMNGINGTMYLLNVTGPARAVTTFSSYTSCCFHLGPFPFAADFMTGTGTIEFSGVRMVFTPTYIPGASATLDTMYLWSDFTSYQIGANGGPAGPAPTPEPGMIGLLGLGLAGVVAARRRKVAA